MIVFTMFPFSGMLQSGDKSFCSTSGAEQSEYRIVSIAKGTKLLVTTERLITCLYSEPFK